jgi:hypothetical protein
VIDFPKRAVKLNQQRLWRGERLVEEYSALKSRDQSNSTDHEQGSGQPPAIERMNVHPEPAEVVDREGHQNVGSDRQAGEGSRADRVDEKQAGDDRKGSDQPAERRPPWHGADPTRTMFTIGSKPFNLFLRTEGKIETR